MADIHTQAGLPDGEVSFRFDEKSAQALSDLASAIKSGTIRQPNGFGAVAGMMDGGVSYRGGGFRKRQPWQFRAGQAVPAHPAFDYMEGYRKIASLQPTAMGDAMKFAQPERSDVHVDTFLTNISIQYQNDDYIGTMLFPRVIVDKLTDLWPIYDFSAWLRDEAEVRGPAGRYRRSGYTISKGGPYILADYGMEHPIPDEIRSNTDSPLSADVDAANWCMEKMLIRIERLVYTLVHTSGNWTTNLTLAGGSQWSDFVNSDPLSDVATIRLTIKQQTGRWPNTMEQGAQVFEKLCLHPDLVDRCKYTGTNERPAMVSAEMMAALFKVDQIHVGGAIYETANEGATSSPSFVWGKHAWFGHVAPAPALRTPSAGYVFTQGLFAERYRAEEIRSDIARCREMIDPHATAAGAGERVINAVA